MSWFRKFFSADNSEIDVKAVLSAGAFIVAVAMFMAYGIKGLFVKWDMPKAIENLSAWLIGGGIVGAGTTLLNQKLGVHIPPASPEKESEGPVG